MGVHMHTLAPLQAVVSQRGTGRLEVSKEEPSILRILRAGACFGERGESVGKFVSL